MNRFSIRDLENLTGIKAHTIRIWEQRYGILQPKRTPTNIRYYDADDLKAALRVSLLNRFGYKISRINRMSEDDMKDVVESIGDRTFRLEAGASALLEATLAMDTASIDEQLSAYAAKHGVENLVEELVFGFLEKIGLMWLTDRISPAQEHLASAVIKRKIAVAIEGLPRPARYSPQVLLFLPEQEIHDIGLTYAHYLLRKAGLDPMYLGANTPLEDVKLVYDVRRPPYLYVHLTLATGNFDARTYLSDLCRTFPDATILASGALLRADEVPHRSNLRCFFNLTEARDGFAELARAVQ